MSRRTLAASTDRQSRHGWCVHFSSLLVVFAILILPARGQIDTNSNGMSDVWERLFNNGELFDPQNPDHAPGADPDGDGWSNLKESIAGTDPFYGNPPEGMVATQITYLKDQEEAPTPEFPEGRIIDLTVISWETLPGKQYTLLFSPDLTASSWLAASAPIIGDGQPAAVSVTLTDAEGEEPDKLFWRVAIDDLDSDGDGLTDHEEFALGLNPYSAQTHPGISDFWVAENFPNSADTFDPNAVPHDNGLTNQEMHDLGIDPNQNVVLGPVNLGTQEEITDFPDLSFREENPADLYHQDSVEGWEAVIGEYIEVWDRDDGNPYMELQSHLGAHGVKQNFEMLPGSQVSFILRYKGRYEWYAPYDNAFTLDVEGAEQVTVNGSVVAPSGGVSSATFMDDDDEDKYEEWHYASIVITASPSAGSLVPVTLSFTPVNTEPVDGQEITRGGFVNLIPFEIIPSGTVAEVSADDAEIVIVARMGDAITDSSSSPPFDGSIIEWEIVSGTGGSLAETTSTVTDGLTAVTLNTSTTAGDTYVVKARVKYFPGQGELDENSAWFFSTEVVVVPGQPYTIALSSSKSSYLSDGTDTAEIEAEIRDQAGNLVVDGTSVTWGVNQSPTPPFASLESETTDGIATAVVVAPLIPEDQIVSVTAGAVSEDTTITVERVTGSISGSINLDVGGQSPSTSTITANVDAIDGTPVFWFTSNGEITEQSSVSGGSATATLSTQSGRLGTVVVTATVGDRLLIHEGAFVSNNGFAIGADYPVIVGDATSNGSEIVNYDHGLAREIPHFASTPVRLRGPANQVVNVSVQGSLPVAEWVFSSATNGVVESVTGNHPLTLVGSGATIFQNIGITGQGALALDGNSHATVEADTELDFTSEFTAMLRVLAGSHQASTLISKPGSWKIEMLGDGNIRAVVETDQGTYSATSSSALAINTWSEIELDFRFNGLTLSVNQVLVAETATSGTLNVNSQPFSIGNGFEGFIDALSLRSDAALGSHIGITGLGAGGVIQLDANGDGSFTVSSLGSAPHGMDIHIEASYNPRTRTKIRSVGKWLWNAVSDCAISFVGGDPQTTAGTVASIAGGILVVGDVGSICKNLWRMTSFSDTDPNYLELTLGGLGVATTALAVTGVGAAIPAAIAPLKTLAIRFGNEGAKMINVFIDMIRHSIATGVISFQLRHLALIERMVTDIPVSGLYRIIGQTPDMVNAAARVGDDVIGIGAGFHQAAVRALATHGDDIAKALTKTLDDIEEAAMATLRALPTNQFDEALDGLARVLAHGIDPIAMSRVLNNHHIYGTVYDHARLIKDLDLLVDGKIKGIRLLVGALKSTTKSVRGVRYELEGAAHLMRNGDEVVELTKRIQVGPLRSDVTDIDIVIQDGVELIYYQLKSTRVAFSKEGTTMVNATLAWIGKAAKEMKIPMRDAVSSNRIRYAVPSLDVVPPSVQKAVFDENAIGQGFAAMRIDIIPLTP